MTTLAQELISPAVLIVAAGVAVMGPLGLVFAVRERRRIRRHDREIAALRQESRRIAAQVLSRQR